MIQTQNVQAVAGHLWNVGSQEEEKKKVKNEVVQPPNVQPVVQENDDSLENPPVSEGENMSELMIQYEGHPSTFSQHRKEKLSRREKRKAKIEAYKQLQQRKTEAHQ